MKSENDWKGFNVSNKQGLSNILDATEAFVRAAGQLETIGIAANPEDAVRQLRLKLHKEESTEYIEGEEASDPVEIADGLLDTIVVAWGTMLVYFGPELSKEMAASVADSNLSKILPDGTVLKREDGKVMKPEGYFKPRIAEILKDVEYTVTDFEIEE